MIRTRSGCVRAMAGVVAALVVGPAAPGRASERYAEQVDLAVAQVAGGFGAPLLVTHAGDGGTGGRGEIWAYGLRNPWRFSFDEVAEEIWIADVGQGSVEEVNRQPAGAPGINYGWNVMEGAACYPPGSSCDPAGLTLPITTYGHGPGNCSVTGGHVYRGDDFPDMAGLYFFGDFCSGRIWSVQADGPPSQEPVEMLDTNHSISSFGESEDGEMFMTDLSGTLYRLVDSS
ncbi:MAG TPA: PQQ-dependent sugar dehydrogenase [Actinomycetota bacterium]|nr:PQQ-dependent sugar dehydrogenase [Actinomycetota bacterium]